MRIESPSVYFEAIARRARDPWLHDAVGRWEIDVDGAGSWTIHLDPQAWALRTMLGLDPRGNRLLVDAQPPSELESLELRGLPGRWSAAEAAGRRALNRAA
jgi:hypothetical protein